jgi:DNA uptake protein ComE-like DNA-binding protein
MSLRKPTVPGDVLRAFTTGLGDFISSGSPLWSLLLNKYTPIQAYNLLLWRKTGPSTSESLFCGPTPTQSYLKSLKTLDGWAIPTGWRFFAAEDDLYGASHVGSIVPGLPSKLTGFSNSVQVLAAIESYQQLPTVPICPPGDFEIRILRVTWLHLEAFWLYWLPPSGNGSTSSGPPSEAANGPNRGYDVIVPYMGFVESSSCGELSPMTAYLLPDFLLAIWEQASDVCTRSLASQASIQEAQAQRIRSCAGAQESSAYALSFQANALDAQAEAATSAAARAQVRANINRATAKHIEIALGLTSAEAEAIVKHSKEQKGIRSWEGLGQVTGVDPSKLLGKEPLVGFGRRRGS